MSPSWINVWSGLGIFFMKNKHVDKNNRPCRVAMRTLRVRRGPVNDKVPPAARLVHLTRKACAEAPANQAVEAMKGT